jgi:hypothetical protein
MQNYVISKSFEHLHTQTLPKKAHKIIASIVKRHRHTSGSPLQPKQLELATAFLRMRLYQAFGPESRHYVEQSMQELERRLQGDSVRTKAESFSSNIGSQPA